METQKPLSSLNGPTTGRFHGRPRWPEEFERGVLVRNERVDVPIDELLPRLVFRGDMTLCDVRDHLVVGPIGSRDDYLTVTFCPDLVLSVGCFIGTLDAFEQEVAMKEPGDSCRIEYEALIAFLRILATTRHRCAEDAQASA